jgi:hypothetical protein
MKKFLVVASSIGLLLSSLLVAPAANSALKCPDPAKDGKAIGQISFEKVKVPVTSITYPKGGVMDPPGSPQNAGLSARHNPLSSQTGSSIITWHINFNGCSGALNPIMKKDIGFTFSVRDEKGVVTRYGVTEKFTVPKGAYLPEWFELAGPRQLVLITCTGKFVKGHYQDNLVIIARPVVG